MNTKENQYEIDLLNQSSRVRASVISQIAQQVEDMQEALFIKELPTKTLKKLIRLGQEELFLRRNKEKIK